MGCTIYQYCLFNSYKKKKSVKKYADIAKKYTDKPSNFTIKYKNICPITHEKTSSLVIVCSKCAQAANAKEFDAWITNSQSCPFCRQNNMPFYFSIIY